MKTILVSGTAGFIFSNFIRKVVNEYPQYRFVGIDKIAKEYTIDNLFEHKNYKFYLADMSDAHIMNNIFNIEKPNIVINGAASSFVDDSITDIMPFLNDNVIGAQVLVNCALKYNIEQLIHISSDEVYGQKLNKLDMPWTEIDTMAPRNPYSCSKGATELIINAAHFTHKLPYKITRSANVFGPRQKKLNLIPHIITSLLENKEIHIHGDGSNFRQYIYVDDKIDAIMKIVENGFINNIYNIGDNNYYTNLEMVNYIASLIDIRPNIRFIEDRKSHDKGYSISSKKLEKLNWKPQISFEEGMIRTINFFKNK